MLPRVQPIAPIRRPVPFDDPDWLFDLKYDGFRGLCYLEQGRCRMISRNGNLMSRFGGLGEQIAAALGVSDAILDGEVIAADETGRPQFYDLLRNVRAPAYVAFDLIWLNGGVGRCRSPSAVGACRTSCPKGQRSFARRCRSRAGVTSSSYSCWYRAGGPSATSRRAGGA